MMTPKELKALPVWGAQNGLLSLSEISLLQATIEAIECSDTLNVLEIGHYYGLSTCAIYQGLVSRGTPWRLTTVDAHIADKHVPEPAPVHKFWENKRKYFDHANIEIFIQRSEAIGAVHDDVVFYDGDHGQEQARFTHIVHKSKDVKVFIFDDADFDIPRDCRAFLLDNGWRDIAPPQQRLSGDKMNDDTMTLAIMIRGGHAN